MACQHSNGHFVLPDHPRLYLKVGDFATSPLQACTGTTSFPYKHLPCNKACSSTSADLVGEKGFLTGTITRTHGSRGREALPYGDDHSHARIAWAKRAS